MLIADTGFFFAISDRRDAFHAQAVECLTRLREPLITTWPVLTETAYLLAARVSADAAFNFLNAVADGMSIVHALEPAQIRHLSKLMKKYADLPMDLADASLMLLAEHLDDGRILSTDARDFKTYRFKNHKPFKNVLLTD